MVLVDDGSALCGGGDLSVTALSGNGGGSDAVVVLVLLSAAVVVEA